MSKGRISPPNYTQIPNVIFDHWLPILSPGEFKVLLCIARQTFGWHKDKARISLKQLVEKTGLTKKPITEMIERLVAHGIVKKIKSKDQFDGSDAPNEYEISVYENEEVEGGGGFQTPPPSVFKTPPPVSLEHPPSSSVSIQRERKVEKERPVGGVFRQPFGVAGIIRLSAEEHQKFLDQYDEAFFSQMVDEMNDYCEATGKRYQNYAAAMRNWIRRRNEKHREVKWQDPKRNRSQKNMDGSDTDNQYADLF